MKKLNVLLLSAVALGMTAVSCSDDKEELKVPVGKWTYDTVIETKGGSASAEKPVNNAACDDVRYLHFKNAGVLEDGYVDPECVFTAYQGTYTQTGNVVNIVESDGYKLSYTLVSVTATKMTVKEFDPADPTHFYTLTLIKK